MSNSKVFSMSVLLTVFGYTASLSIPYRRPCHDMTPDCVKKSLQAAIPVFANGVPELGLETLDPYLLSHINLTLSGINIEFGHGYARGMKTCIIDSARVVDDTLESQYHCNLTIRGRYKSSGSLLTFPIDGEGLSSIKCNNIKFHSKLELGIKEKNGQEYFYVKDFHIKHAYGGRVTYAMTNLFRDNPEITKAILDFMNTNWRMVAEEFGSPVVEYGVQSIMRNVHHLLEVMTVDDFKKL